MAGGSTTLTNSTQGPSGLEIGLITDHLLYRPDGAVARAKDAPIAQKRSHVYVCSIPVFSRSTMIPQPDQSVASVPTCWGLINMVSYNGIGLLYGPVCSRMEFRKKSLASMCVVVG